MEALKWQKGNLRKRQQRRNQRRKKQGRRNRHPTVLHQHKAIVAKATMAFLFVIGSSILNSIVSTVILWLINYFRR